MPVRASSSRHHNASRSLGFTRARVECLDDDDQLVHCMRQAFEREPDFRVTSVNYDSSAYFHEREHQTDDGEVSIARDESVPGYD